MSEDERIDFIGRTVTARQTMSAFCVDDEPGKPERYIRKLLERFPSLEIVDQFKGPVPNVISVRVRPKGN